MTDLRWRLSRAICFNESLPFPGNEKKLVDFSFRSCETFRAELCKNFAKFRQNWNWTTQLRWILFERWVPGTSLRGPVIWLKFAVLREVSQAAEVQLTSRKTKRLWVFQPKLKHFFEMKIRVCSPIKIIEKKAKWSQLNWSKRETMKTEPFVCANKWPTKKSLGILCYWASRG